eukprot:11816491-Karenia_brevis.AAC.1
MGASFLWRCPRAYRNKGGTTPTHACPSTDIPRSRKRKYPLGIIHMQFAAHMQIRVQVKMGVQ